MVILDFFGFPIAFTHAPTKPLYTNIHKNNINFVIFAIEVRKMAEGRCMKCKKSVEIQSGKEVVMKNGMKAMKGVCGKCGTAVFRILGKA